jgi:hypothetical protein
MHGNSFETGTHEKWKRNERQNDEHLSFLRYRQSQQQLTKLPIAQLGLKQTGYMTIQQKLTVFSVSPQSSNDVCSYCFKVFFFQQNKIAKTHHTED